MCWNLRKLENQNFQDIFEKENKGGKKFSAFYLREFELLKHLRKNNPFLCYFNSFQWSDRCDHDWKVRVFSEKQGTPVWCQQCLMSAVHTDDSLVGICSRCFRLGSLMDNCWKHVILRNCSYIPVGLSHTQLLCSLQLALKAAQEGRLQSLLLKETRFVVSTLSERTQ